MDQQHQQPNESFDVSSPEPPAPSWSVPPPGSDASDVAPIGPVVAGAPAPVATVRALLAGAAAAAVAAGLWTAVVALTNYQVGIAAVGVGLLVGVAVRYTAGAAAGRGLQAGSVGLTVLSMAAAEYLVVRHFVVQELAAEGLEGSVPVLLPPGDMVWVVVESLRFDPLTLVFWVIAMVTAWRLSDATRQTTG